jgi:hypothetical protein
MNEPRDEKLWERGWEGHHRAQAKRLAHLPLTEKLRWLEETHALVRHLRESASPDERPDTPR